jgi:hypothetical protein
VYRALRTTTSVAGKPLSTGTPFPKFTSNGSYEWTNALGASPMTEAKPLPYWNYLKNHSTPDWTQPHELIAYNSNIVIDGITVRPKVQDWAYDFSRSDLAG